jgi:hypothetical protein
MNPVARHLLMTVSLALCSNIYAQSYRALLHPTAIWQDHHAWISPGPNTSSRECYHITLGGDSIIDGTTYKILRRSGWWATVNGVDWYNGEWGLIREDTLERRVYFRQYGWSIDFLFYDFSVGIGPYPPTIRFSQDLYVNAIDTIILSSGEHRRFHMGPQHYIIEGIGSTMGFMKSTLGGEIPWDHTLVCHRILGEINYTIIHDECPCNDDVGISLISASPLSISPSPTTGIAKLNGADPHAPYFIRSMEGRLIAAGRCSSDGSAMIDLSEMAAAIFQVEVRMVNGSRVVRVVRE